MVGYPAPAPEGKRTATGRRQARLAEGPPGYHLTNAAPPAPEEWPHLP
jgi:hypothetical protein